MLIEPDKRDRRYEMPLTYARVEGKVLCSGQPLFNRNHEHGGQIFVFVDYALQEVCFPKWIPISIKFLQRF